MRGLRVGIFFKARAVLIFCFTAGIPASPAFSRRVSPLFVFAINSMSLNSMAMLTWLIKCALFRVCQIFHPVHIYLLSIVKEVRQVWMSGPVFDNTVAVDFQIDVIAILARHDTVGNIAFALDDNLSIAVN